MENNEQVTLKNNSSLSEFQKNMQLMVSTNEAYYNQIGIRTLGQVTSSYFKTYTKEEVYKILSSDNISDIQKLSRDYFKLDGHYRTICLNYITMLKYRGILIPYAAESKKLQDRVVQKRYNDALNFIEKLNIPTLCAGFAERVIRDGCYYGIIQNIDKNGLSIIDLPSIYCKTNFKDFLGNDLIEFNLGYFNTIADKKEREKVLNAYPKEIQKAYRKYDDGKRYGWYMIPSDISICFPFFDGRPPFAHIIPSIIDYEEALKNVQERDREEIKKILVQKVPHLASTGELVFEPDEALEMHKGTVGMLKKNPHINVLTTYADVEMESSDRDDDGESMLDKASSAIYEKAGVSKELFSATGNLTLDKAVKNNLSLVMYMANKFSIFITGIINRLYKNNSISFKYNILPISYYNDSDYISDSHKLASSGYSYLLPALAMDLSQKDLIAIKDLENEVLDLRDKLIPLSTSYTESAGAPEKPESQKSDKTIKNNEALNNGENS